MISSISVGPMDNNVYLVCVDEGTILVDPAAEAPRILSWLAETAPDGIDAILVTHRHHDHIGALAEVAEATGAAVFAGTPDAAAITEATGVEVTGLWHKNELFGLPLLDLVGHTPGGLALVVPADDAIITGDSLFPGGVGKTHSPEEFESLLRDVTRKIFDAFGDDTRILPGHGAPTTVGAERPNLGEWRQRGW